MSVTMNQCASFATQIRKCSFACAITSSCCLRVTPFSILKGFEGFHTVLAHTAAQKQWDHFRLFELKNKAFWFSFRWVQNPVESTANRFSDLQALSKDILSHTSFLSIHQITVVRDITGVDGNNPYNRSSTRPLVPVIFTELFILNFTEAKPDVILRNVLWVSKKEKGCLPQFCTVSSTPCALFRASSQSVSQVLKLGASAAETWSVSRVK